MAAKIKLQRKGKKGYPIYRVVIQDESAARDSKVLEVLGQYNPMVEPTIFNVDKEKTLAWIKKGADPTEKVRILLGKAGILPPIDLAALPKKKSKKEEKAAEEAAAKAEEEAKSAVPAEAPKVESASAEAPSSDKSSENKPADKPEPKKEEAPKAEPKKE